MVRHFLIPLLVNILLITTSNAQEYAVRNYNMRDGLSHSTVYRIYQDHKGFLWFCTNYGLSTFDGKTFHNYYTQDGLSGNIIMSMSEDAAGTKLISTMGGGITIITDSSITKYAEKGVNIPPNIIYATKNKNTTWLVDLKGRMYLTRIYKNKLSRISFSTPKHQVLVNKIISYGDTTYIICTNGIYYAIDSTIHPFLRNLINEEVIDISKKANGDIWLGFKNKILLLSGNKIIKKISLGSNHTINRILSDKSGNVWISTSDYHIMIIRNNAMEEITNYLNIPKTIINDLFEDSEGNIWIATYNEGICRFNSLDALSYTVKNNLNIYIKSLADYGNNAVLIGTIGKVSIWEKGKINHIHVKLLKPDQYIYFVKRIKNILYIGTPYGLISKSLSYPYKEFIFSEKAGTGYGAISFYKDSKGTLWLGGYGSLFRLKDGKCIQENIPPEIIGRRFNAILEDHNGKIWFGTDSGLLIKDGDKYRQLALCKQPGILNNINAIFEDTYQRIWLATEGGLFCFQQDTPILFTQQNGLTANKCNALAEDKNHKLWIGTLNGLSYIDLNTLQAKAYLLNIYPKEVLSLYCNKSDTLFVGTADGISILKTNLLSTDDTPPPLYISAVKTARHQLKVPEKIELAYNENKLSIDFIGLSYRYADMINYRYKIKGLDENWHYTKNTSIELPAIPSGDYLFILNARQNASKWSNDVTLAIHVSTPYWKTWPFILILSALLAIIFFLISSWAIIKHESNKRKNLLLYNKIIYLKQQALGVLINPHFIFNSMNSIQHYLNKHDNDLANAYLADFASLMRITIENAREAFISLSQELSRIKLYLSLEQLRFGEQLQYEISIDPQLETDSIRIPNMILQPYIENAIWHGIMPKNAEGKIQISIFKNTDKELKILIKDNGVGLKTNANKQAPPKQHRPLGMKITQERLELLNKLSGQYYFVRTGSRDAGDNTSGTAIEITLPLQPNEKLLEQIEEELNA